MFINIIIESKNIKSLKLYFLTLNNFLLLRNYIILLNKIIIKNNINTFHLFILKSPHVHKKSGEKFIYNNYKKNICLNTNEFYLISLFLKKINLFYISDISINLKINFKQLDKYFLNKCLFNPDKYFLNKKKYITYLKLIDIFGENSYIINKKLFFKKMFG